MVFEKIFLDADCRYRKTASPLAGPILSYSALRVKEERKGKK